MNDIPEEPLPPGDYEVEIALGHTRGDLLLITRGPFKGRTIFAPKTLLEKKIATVEHCEENGKPVVKVTGIKEGQGL